MNEGLFLVADGALSELEKRRAKARYRTDPVAWTRDVLGIQLWIAQQKVAMSVVTEKNVVVKAGHEVGKSFLAGVLICWWVDVHWDLPGGCFVVSTAPSTKQINAIVWREVRRFKQLADKRFNEGLIDHTLPGYITADAHWRLDNGIELGYGSKPPESKEDTMSGIHARYVFAVGDEAVGLSKALIGDLANITSNATSRRFLICNPTNPLAYVASIFKQDMKNWSKHTISVFDSPNFHGGGRCWEGCTRKEEHASMPFGEGLPVEVLETLVDQSYVDGIIEEHGFGSPTYISRVTGEFAWDMGFTLFRPEDIAKAQDVDIVPSIDILPRLGVDVSRSKDGDKNTVYVYHDGKVRFHSDWNDPDAMGTARKIVEIAKEVGAFEVRIDGAGLGGPIADAVREFSNYQLFVIEIIGSDPSPDRTRWWNFRAWMYWSVQQSTSKGEIDMDHEDDKLEEQLLGVEIKKRLSGNEALLLESKEEMRKRGVHSPDHADAAMYACVDLSWLLEGEPEGTVHAMEREEVPGYGLEEYIRRDGSPLIFRGFGRTSPW